MPLLNPFYWFGALLLLWTVLLISVGLGVAAYATCLIVARRRSPILLLARLPIGIGVAVTRSKGQVVSSSAGRRSISLIRQR